MADNFLSDAANNPKIAIQRRKEVKAVGRKKLAYCAPLLFLLFFTSLIGCALVDETPTEPVTAETPSPEPAPAQQPTVALPPAAPVAMVPPVIASFNEAVTAVAHAIFSQAKTKPVLLTESGQQPWVIDPLIDAVSGVQSNATRSMQARIVEIARSNFPQFALQTFSAQNLKNAPLVLLGTFTAVNNEGESRGLREAYRICLALADLKSATIIAQSTTRTPMAGIDHSPTPYFRDRPAWMKEAGTDAYVNACEGTKVGDAIPSSYIEAILASTAASEAIAAYENGRYRDALDLFNSALKTSAGNQLLLYNGLYLSNLKLGRHAAANEAFSKLVDYGLTHKRLAVKFLFKPGTTAYWPDRQVSGPYSMWLKQIARRTLRSNSCLEITGHTSATGAEPFNERLSQLRAEYIKRQLEIESPQLRARTIASGAGSREVLIGTGKDDITDALDRRIVFQVHSCS